MWVYSRTMSPDELYHYGVLGMKWGVRRNRSAARVKADAKTKKLKKKLAKVEAKSRKAETLLDKRRSKRAKTEIGYALQERAFRRANKKKYKVARAKKKLDRWESAVEREFGKTQKKKKQKKK